MGDSQDAEASYARSKAPHGTDGALDRMLRLGHKTKQLPAVFIHAGAGFHSHQNEHVHLQACVAAVKMGMKFLKAGSSSTEAVEAALRVLEDKEITNAGYGSNLSIDGQVECDATIVDHLGRSGACGAVPNIRNPISLAKLILDTSNQPLSLRRVPPNALIGEGAKTFAEEHGMATFANEYLVSKNARDRYLRWQDDLKRANLKSSEEKTAPETPQISESCTPCQYDNSSPRGSRRSSQRDHSAAVMAGTWNEGQPDSPFVMTPTPEAAAVPAPETPPVPGYFRVLSQAGTTSDRSPVRATPETAYPSSSGSPSSKLSEFSTHRLRHRGRKSKDTSKHKYQRPETTPGDEWDLPDKPDVHRDGSFSPDILQPARELLQPATSGTAISTAAATGDFQSSLGTKRPASDSDGSDVSSHTAKRSHVLSSLDTEDLVTDTIGAIAIDENGQMAAASSSGGIGMKHHGRLGPAALVGIGTAIVPCAEGDEDKLSVAAVTSGTGEHMATTMASQRCAERLYQGTRRGPFGRDVHDDDEDAILESFIADDFMAHPGVKGCHSVGAIGVMAVKKSRTGYYLYFAHNTDSFALASMGGNDREPRCTMSRLPNGSDIAKGGRKIRVD